MGAEGAAHQLIPMPVGGRGPIRGGEHELEASAGERGEMGFDLGCGRVAVGDELLLDLSDVGRLQSAHRGHRHREVGVRADVLEAASPQPMGQGAAVGEIDAGLCQQHQEALPNSVGAPSIGVGRVRYRRAGERLEGHVVILDEQDPAGAQGGHHSRERLIAVGDMDKHEACMDEVESRAGRRVVGDVVAVHFHDPTRPGSQP
jgi:hypothetical protein